MHGVHVPNSRQHVIYPLALGCVGLVGLTSVASCNGNWCVFVTNAVLYVVGCYWCACTRRTRPTYAASFPSEPHFDLNQLFCLSHLSVLCRYVCAQHERLTPIFAPLSHIESITKVPTLGLCGVNIGHPTPSHSTCFEMPQKHLELVKNITIEVISSPLCPS